MVNSTTVLQNEFGDNEVTRDWVLSWKHRVESGWLAAGGVSVSVEPAPETVARSIANLYIKNSCDSVSMGI